jgi:hypothetical protein
MAKKRKCTDKLIDSCSPPKLTKKLVDIRQMELMRDFVANGAMTSEQASLVLIGKKLGFDLEIKYLGLYDSETQGIKYTYNVSLLIKKTK